MGKRQFGSIRQLRSGRWQARYWNPAGAMVAAPKPFATKADAARWLTLMESSMLRGDYQDPALARTTFSHWAEKWFLTKSTLKTKTRVSYRSVLDNHLLPQFGREAIASVDTPTMRAYLTGELAAGRAKGTVKKFRAVLSGVLATAVEGGAIRANPALGIHLGGEPRVEKFFFSPGQVMDLAHAIGNPEPRGGGPPRTFPEYELLVLFAAYTGLRAGELAALRTRRLDLVRGKVDVAESLAEVPGGLEFGPTKNYQRRAVDVPRFLIERLVTHLAGRGPEDLVFTSPSGSPLRQTNFYARFYRPAVRAAGIPERATFHDLRHTYAAFLISSNAPSLVVMRRMGHSSIKVTLETYGHIFPAVEEEITGSLDHLGRSAQRSSDAVVVALDTSRSGPGVAADVAQAWHGGTAAER